MAQCPALYTFAAGTVILSAYTNTNNTNLRNTINTNDTNLTASLALKANLASPTFTGTVTIPTGAVITKPTITNLNALKDTEVYSAFTTTSLSASGSTQLINNGTIGLGNVTTGDRINLYSNIKIDTSSTSTEVEFGIWVDGGTAVAAFNGVSNAHLRTFCRTPLTMADAYGTVSAKIVIVNGGSLFLKAAAFRCTYSCTVNSGGIYAEFTYKQ